MNFWKRLFGGKGARGTSLGASGVAPARRAHSATESPGQIDRPVKQEGGVLGETELIETVRGLNDSTKRKASLSALAGQSGSKVIAVIRNTMLASSDYLERYSAASALGHVGREFGWVEVVPLLERCLDDEKEFVSGEAIWGLNWATYNDACKPAVASTVSRCLARLVAIFAKTTDIQVLSNVRSLLPLGGPACVPLIASLLPTLSKYQVEYATELLEQFKASPTQTKAAILESLRSSDVARRKKACYDSVDIADAKVIDSLIRVLKEFPEPQYNSREDVYQSTRKGAAYALGKIGDPRSVAALRDALKQDHPWGVRNDGTLVGEATGMRTFGTSVGDGLKEANTDFARSVLEVTPSTPGPSRGSQAVSPPDTTGADRPLFASRKADPGVRFVRKYTEPGKLGHTNTYEIYAAENSAAAREFLLSKKVEKQMYYMAVETPDGNWGLDIDGLYHERLMAWQKDLASAQIDGYALDKMPRGEDLKNAALGHRDNFVHEVMCGACGEIWPDALRYQNRTVVRCPKCGLLNSIDTSRFHSVIVGGK